MLPHPTAGKGLLCVFSVNTNPYSKSFQVNANSVHEDKIIFIICNTPEGLCIE